MSFSHLEIDMRRLRCIGPASGMPAEGRSNRVLRVYKGFKTFSRVLLFNGKNIILEEQTSQYLSVVIRI